MPTPAPPSLGDPQFRPQAPSPSNYAEMYQKFMSDQANNAFQQDQVMGTVSPPAPSDFSSYQDFLPDGAFKKQDSMWGGSGVPAPQPSSIYDYTGYIPNSSFK